MNDRTRFGACVLAPRPATPSARARAREGRRAQPLSRRTARLAAAIGARRFNARASSRPSPSR
ncbi:hypothetical protein DWV00_05055 [Trinickia dinghuensis]|uniref:Uncharacterized protein n=1 Tax=Trinickia dinghuensis TaxID=2291023 RepID=A0A3D8K4J2_9BURK|nr:hypothetical protein DWV00_05055 [Trinickia dinghuensis]